MSSSSPPPPDGSQPPYRRLKLVMTTSENQRDLPGTTRIGDNPIKEELSRSSSPVRPSYSPVTPTLSQSSPTAHDLPEPEWIDEPEPLPVSLDENSDAIALRATLSLLQMQRQQSLRDIRSLNKLRQDAVASPVEFVEDLKKGKLSKPVHASIALDPDQDSSDDEAQTAQQDDSRFGKLPNPQNIARCPPIAWSKYHIVGEALDQLHEKQRKYPDSMENSVTPNFRRLPQEVVAPYRPWSDRLAPTSPSNQTRTFDG